MPLCPHVPAVSTSAPGAFQLILLGSTVSQGISAPVCRGTRFAWRPSTPEAQGPTIATVTPTEGPEAADQTWLACMHDDS